MGHGPVVAEWVRAQVSESRGPGFESHRHCFLGKFVYPTLPKSLGTLLVYPKRMAVGVKPIEAFHYYVIYGSDRVN